MKKEFLGYPYVQETPLNSYNNAINIIYRKQYW